MPKRQTVDMLGRLPGFWNRRLVEATLGLALSAGALAAIPVTSGAPGASDAPAGGHRSLAPQSFGAPRWTAPLGNVEFTSPAYATIDGVRAVVAASLTGTVYVRNAVTGALLPGWPRQVRIRGERTTYVDSSPAVAYLDGPAKPPTIVVGAGSLFQRSHPANGGLIAFRANGSVRFVFHTKATFGESGPASAGLDDAVFSTPAVGDITGNGQDDIVFGSFDHYIYALSPSGKLLPGFPIQRADTIWSSPALADITHTGLDDIIIGGDASGFRSMGGQPCFGGWITDYRYSARLRSPVLVWERCIGETVWSSPAVGVINLGSSNPTGRPAVVVGTSWYPGYAESPARHEVFAFYADNGQTVPGWPVKARGSTFGSPVIAPAVAGGRPLVISTSCADCLRGPSVVSAWQGSGRLVWSRAFSKRTEVLSSPAVANVTGEGPNDVLVGNALGVYVLDAATGEFVDGTAKLPLAPHCRTNGTPALSPVGEASGGPPSGWMMVVSCATGTLRDASGRLVSYALPRAPDSAPPWPEWRANAARTGVADPLVLERKRCAIPASTSGYRLVSASAREFSFGSLPDCGGGTKSLLPSAVVDEVGTPDGGGYWMLTADGTVYSFGDARFYGDARTGNWRGGPAPPGPPFVSMAATPDGRGYLLADSAGDVYAFGDAPYRGSPAGRALGGEVVGVAVAPSSTGYWIVTSGGSVQGFGVRSLGSAAGLSGQVVGIAAGTDPSPGYYVFTRDGRVDAFGVRNFGSVLGRRHSPITGMAVAPGGRGYYLVAADGSVFSRPASLKQWGSAAHLDHSAVIGAISTN